MTPFQAPQSDTMHFIYGASALGLTVFDNVYNTVQGRPVIPPITGTQLANGMTGASALAAISWGTVAVIGLGIYLLMRRA